MQSDKRKKWFDEHGYVLARGLFSADEAARYRDHFMDLRSRGPYDGDFAGLDPTSDDPLKRYPRMIHMHRWDTVSRDYLTEPRINELLTRLAGREPLAVQTMLYFKPAGARGQAFHQDNYYLRVQPGTCLAAWLALDDCDEENGCMEIVPGSHNWPLLCVDRADTSQSFTDVAVPLPTETPVESMIMKAGDVLFFNGALVHGSKPNSSTNRFRRALIGHYIDGNAQQVASFYQPALRMDGSPVEISDSPEGSECGVWVEQDGSPVIKASGTQGEPRKTDYFSQ